MKRVTCANCTAGIMIKKVDYYPRERYFCDDECLTKHSNTPINEWPEYNRGLYKRGIDYPSEYCCYNCYLNNEKNIRRVCSCKLCAEHGCKHCDHR